MATRGRRRDAVLCPKIADPECGEEIKETDQKRNGRRPEKNGFCPQHEIPLTPLQAHRLARIHGSSKNDLPDRIICLEVNAQLALPQCTTTPVAMTAFYGVSALVLLLLPLGTGILTDARR